MAIRIWRQLLQANHKSIPRCWSPHPPRGQHQSEKYDVGASWECPQPQYNRTLIVAPRRRSPGTCGRSAKYSRRVGTQGPTDRANHHQNRQLGPDIAHRHIRNFDRCGRLVGMDRNFGLSRPIADCPAIVDGPAANLEPTGRSPESQCRTLCTQHSDPSSNRLPAAESPSAGGSSQRQPIRRGIVDPAGARKFGGDVMLYGSLPNPASSEQPLETHVTSNATHVIRESLHEVGNDRRLNDRRRDPSCRCPSWSPPTGRAA